MMEGLGADSEEKHEPASDIDAAAVDGLKALDPSPTTSRTSREVQFGAILGSLRCPLCVRYLDLNGHAADIGEGPLKTQSRLWSAQQPDADNDKDAGECHPDHGVASASCEITAENDTGH
jgi:hypothetical protein